MSLLNLTCIILALASIASASIGPHFDFAPTFPGAPLAFAPQPVLPPPVYPTPVLHAHAPAPLWPAPAFPVSAPYWPAPAPAPVIPAPLPLPLPITRPLPPLIEALPFAPSYRAIPGPVTKTHHVSVGFAHPVQLAKVVSAPHVHPVKLIAQPSHAHFHSHSASLHSLPHHHHHVIA